MIVREAYLEVWLNLKVLLDANYFYGGALKSIGKPRGDGSLLPTVWHEVQGICVLSTVQG